jgi:hypothetical protein
VIAAAQTGLEEPNSVGELFFGFPEVGDVSRPVSPLTVDAKFNFPRTCKRRIGQITFSDRHENISRSWAFGEPSLNLMPAALILRIATFRNRR